MDPHTNLYLRYYQDQQGGQITYFRGAKRYQVGAGIGDVLKGIFRTVLPIAAHGASTFLNEMFQAKGNQAPNWGAAAKAAIVPTARQVIDDSIEKITRRGKQSGSGRKKKYRRRGSGRVAYKRRSNSRKNKKRHSSKKIKFINF